MNHRQPAYRSTAFVPVVGALCEQYCSRTCRPPRKSGRTGAATATEGPRTPPAKKPGRQGKTAAAKPAPASAKASRTSAASACLTVCGTYRDVPIHPVVQLSGSVYGLNADWLPRWRMSCGTYLPIVKPGLQSGAQETATKRCVSRPFGFCACQAKRAPAAKRGRGAAAGEVEEVPLLRFALCLACTESCLSCISVMAHARRVNCPSTLWHCCTRFLEAVTDAGVYAAVHKAEPSLLDAD